MNYLLGMAYQFEQAHSLLGYDALLWLTAVLVHTSIMNTCKASTKNRNYCDCILF